MKEKIKKYFTVSDSRRMIYDYIRILACLGIICLHTTGDRSEPLGVFFQTTSRIALPLFVLLSGVLLLGNPKKEPYLKFYWKRFVKIVVPYLIYGAIYTGWVNPGHVIPEKLTWEGVKTVILCFPDSAKLNMKMETVQYFHLWFMLMIIGFYIVAPFFQRGLPALSNHDLKWLFAIMLVTYAVIDYLPIFGVEIGIINFFSDWEIFFLAGYVLSRFDNKKTHIGFLIVGTLAVVYMFFGKWKFPDHLGANFYDLAPAMMLATCGSFSGLMLFESIIPKWKWLNWIVSKISNYTFSIYMIHGIMLVNHMAFHPGYNQTFFGTIREVVEVFIKCLIFALIFDNIVTNNVKRILNLLASLVTKLVNKLTNKIAPKTQSVETE